MARFQVNDKVAFVRKSKDWRVIYETYNTGTIIKGPFMVDKINHYQVKWDNINPNTYPGGSEIEMICDFDSTKYGFKLI